jgi:hypothetical protein
MRARQDAAQPRSPSREPYTARRGGAFSWGGGSGVGKGRVENGHSWHWIGLLRCSVCNGVMRVQR